MTGRSSVACLAVPGCAWLCLSVPGGVCPGCAWLWLSLPGCAWLCLDDVFDCAWLCLAVPACASLGFGCALAVRACARYAWPMLACAWLCLDVLVVLNCGSIARWAPSLAVFGSAWLCFAVRGCAWLPKRLAAPGRARLGLAQLGCGWLCLALLRAFAARTLSGYCKRKTMMGNVRNGV